MCIVLKVLHLYLQGLSRCCADAKGMQGEYGRRARSRQAKHVAMLLADVNRITEQALAAQRRSVCRSNAVKSEGIPHKNSAQAQWSRNDKRNRWQPQMGGYGSRKVHRPPIATQNASQTTGALPCHSNTGRRFPTKARARQTHQTSACTKLGDDGYMPRRHTSSGSNQACNQNVPCGSPLKSRATGRHSSRCSVNMADASLQSKPDKDLEGMKESQMRRTTWCRPKSAVSASGPCHADPYLCPQSAAEFRPHLSASTAPSYAYEEARLPVRAGACMPTAEHGNLRHVPGEHNELRACHQVDGIAAIGEDHQGSGAIGWHPLAGVASHKLDNRNVSCEAATSASQGETTDEHLKLGNLGVEGRNETAKAQDSVLKECSAAVGAGFPETPDAQGSTVCGFGNVPWSAQRVGPLAPDTFCSGADNLLDVIEALEAAESASKIEASVADVDPSTMCCTHVMGNSSADCMAHSTYAALYEATASHGPKSDEKMVSTTDASHTISPSAGCMPLHGASPGPKRIIWKAADSQRYAAWPEGLTCDAQEIVLPAEAALLSSADAVPHISHEVVFASAHRAAPTACISSGAAKKSVSCAAYATPVRGEEMRVFEQQAFNAVCGMQLDACGTPAPLVGAASNDGSLRGGQEQLAGFMGTRSMTNCSTVFTAKDAPAVQRIHGMERAVTSKAPPLSAPPYLGVRHSSVCNVQSNCSPNGPTSGERAAPASLETGGPANSPCQSMGTPNSCHAVLKSQCAQDEAWAGSDCTQGVALNAAPSHSSAVPLAGRQLTWHDGAHQEEAGDSPDCVYHTGRSVTSVTFASSPRDVQANMGAGPQDLSLTKGTEMQISLGPLHLVGKIAQHQQGSDFSEPVMLAVPMAGELPSAGNVNGSEQHCPAPALLMPPEHPTGASCLPVAMPPVLPACQDLVGDQGLPDLQLASLSAMQLHQQHKTTLSKQQGRRSAASSLGLDVSLQKPPVVAIAPEISSNVVDGLGGSEDVVESPVHVPLLLTEMSTSEADVPDTSRGAFERAAGEPLLLVELTATATDVLAGPEEKCGSVEGVMSKDAAGRPADASFTPFTAADVSATGVPTAVAKLPVVTAGVPAEAAKKPGSGEWELAKRRDVAASPVDASDTALVTETSDGNVLSSAAGEPIAVTGLSATAAHMPDRAVDMHGAAAWLSSRRADAAHSTVNESAADAASIGRTAENACVMVDAPVAIQGSGPPPATSSCRVPTTPSLPTVVPSLLAAQVPHPVAKVPPILPTGYTHMPAASCEGLQPLRPSSPGQEPQLSPVHTSIQQIWHEPPIHLMPAAQACIKFSACTVDETVWQGSSTSCNVAPAAPVTVESAVSGFLTLQENFNAHGIAGVHGICPNQGCLEHANVGLKRAAATAPSIGASGASVTEQAEQAHFEAKNRPARASGTPSGCAPVEGGSSSLRTIKLPHVSCVHDSRLHERGVLEQTSLDRPVTTAVATHSIPVDSLRRGREERSCVGAAKTENHFKVIDLHGEACGEAQAKCRQHALKQSVCGPHKAKESSLELLRGCQGRVVSKQELAEKCSGTESCLQEVHWPDHRPQMSEQNERSLKDTTISKTVASTIGHFPGLASGSPVINATNACVLRDKHLIRQPPGKPMLIQSDGCISVETLSTQPLDLVNGNKQHSQQTAARPWIPSWLNKLQLPDPPQGEYCSEERARLACPEQLRPLRVRHCGELRVVAHKGRPVHLEAANCVKGPVAGVLARLLQRAAEVGRMVRWDMHH
jgi:hypothetical protein